MVENYLIDDRIIIPQRLKNMSNTEIDAEIKRLEKKLKQKNQQPDFIKKAI